MELIHILGHNTKEVLFLSHITLRQVALLHKVIQGHRFLPSVAALAPRALPLPKSCWWKGKKLWRMPASFLNSFGPEVAHIATTHIPLARTSHIVPSGHHFLVTALYSGMENTKLGGWLAESTTIMFFLRAFMQHVLGTGFLLLHHSSHSWGESHLVLVGGCVSKLLSRVRGKANQPTNQAIALALWKEGPKLQT